MSFSLGSLPITGNVKTSFEAPSQGLKGIIIGNESALTVIITMESGAVEKTLYPATVDFFAVQNNFTGTILINPTVILTNGAQWPSSSLSFDAIGLNDPENTSMYPLSLNRGVNVGNAGTVSSGTSEIVNDGNAAGSAIIEATVSGDVASAVKCSNDAVMSLGTSANKGSLTLAGPLTANGTIAANGIVTAPAANILGTAGNIQNILGQLIVAQLLTTVGAKMNPPVVQGNGSTSGTAKLYQPLQGTTKIAIVLFGNFQNGGASALNLALPVAFNNAAIVLAGDTPNFQLTSSGVAQNMNVLTALGSGGGSTSAVATLHLYSVADTVLPFDTVSMSPGGAAAHNGVLVLIGN